ncbi:MAG: hypothetical protein HY203_09920 [Nitrospirae bacterium]|nr:hypothetical protein [Nitrospirota bacterium]
MKSHRFKTAVVLLGIFLILVTVWLGGCASTPPERPDSEKIKQDSDKGMQDLKKEEDRRGNDY